MIAHVDDHRFQLVELSIINRVTGLRQKTEGDDPANMSAALERLAIDSKDAADQLKEACGSLVKLTVTIDRIQGMLRAVRALVAGTAITH